MNSLHRKILPFAVILIIAISAVFLLESFHFCSTSQKTGAVLPPELVFLTDKINDELILIYSDSKNASVSVSEDGLGGGEDFSYSRMLSGIIAPVENETGASVTVMQTDGLILYDRDSGQVGRNLFSDPFFSKYETLKNLGHVISSKKTGYGTYIFYDSQAGNEKSVKKQAYWDTVENSGLELRIIMFKPVVLPA